MIDVMRTVFDPLRRKEVALTPEEQVRQWCIGVLSGDLGVPLHMMMSEVGMKLGGKQFRADILVYDRHARPLVVVECKRPEVELGSEDESFEKPDFIGPEVTGDVHFRNSHLLSDPFCNWRQLVPEAYQGPDQ